MNVLILHGYSDSNKGDLAIVVGMVQGIRAARPDCRIKLQSVYSEQDPEFEFHHRFVRRLGVPVEQMSVPSPYVDAKGHSGFRNIAALGNLVGSALAELLVRGVPAVGRWFPRQAAALASMQQSDVIVLKGGQYIYNDQHGLRAKLYLWRILHPIYVAHGMGRSIVLLGQSVGPLVDSWGRTRTARALGYCKRLIVRERKTEALMADLGLKHLTELAPDFAFLIDPVRPVGADGTLRELERGAWLGVTVVNWYFPESADPKAKRAAYLDALTEVAVAVHRKHGLGIALFPQVTVQHHGESDLDLLKNLAARLAQQGIPHLLVAEDLAPEELSYCYGRCQVLLGTRLHSCILAACAATPVVAIRYQGFKTEGIMAELGLEDRVFDIAAMDAPVIEAAITASLAERRAISQSVVERVGAFKKHLMKALDATLPA